MLGISSTCPCDFRCVAHTQNYYLLSLSTGPDYTGHVSLLCSHTSLSLDLSCSHSRGCLPISLWSELFWAWHLVYIKLGNTEYTLNICSKIIQLFSCDNTISLTSHSLIHDYSTWAEPEALPTLPPHPFKIKIRPLLIFLLIKHYTFTVKRVKRHSWAKEEKKNTPVPFSDLTTIHNLMYILPNLLWKDTWMLVYKKHSHAYRMQRRLCPVISITTLFVSNTSTL